MGNPFIVTDSRSRESSCDEYEKWFHNFLIAGYSSQGYTDEFGTARVIISSKARAYLRDILACVKQGTPVALLCHCIPERCHGQTIIRYIEHILDLTGGVEVKDKDE